MKAKTLDPISRVFGVADQMEIWTPFQTDGRYGTILIDPPWRFINYTGKVAPEHRRLHRYRTMSVKEIAALPIEKLSLPQSHLYLWCPNALLLEALNIVKSWGFDYKTNIVWLKIRKDGGPDGRGVGWYFRNVTELLLFGVKGGLRTLKPGRTQVNLLMSRKREHSRKPFETYDVVESCSPGPYLELFARQRVRGWTQWGDELDTYEHRRQVHSNDHSLLERKDAVDLQRPFPAPMTYGFDRHWQNDPRPS